MNFIRALNEISSQIWALVLILLGLVAFGMASLPHVVDQVKTALISSATGMIGAGIAMFQHQPKEPQEKRQ